MSKLYFDQAQGLGAYTALKEDEKSQWKTAMAKSTENAIRVLKDFSSSTDASGAIQRLIDITLNRQKGGLIKDAPEKAFMVLFEDLADPVLKARLQIASAAFPYDKGDKATALGLIKGVLSASPSTPLTPEDYNRFGLCLLDAREWDKVVEVAGSLATQYSTVPQAQANALYLQGAAWQSKGDVAQADTYFTKLEKDYPWSDRIFEAKLGRGKAAAERNATDDALKLFREVIMSPRSTGAQKAASLIASGLVLEKGGKLLPEKGPDGKLLDKPNALAFYSKAHEFYGEASPDIGAEALLHVAQVYEKAGQTAEARKNYLALTTIKVYAGQPQVALAAEKIKTLPAP
jgi:tetratricopeptide (TPR) repeat protein